MWRDFVCDLMQLNVSLDFAGVFADRMVQAGARMCRETDHTVEKCIAVGKIACAARANPPADMSIYLRCVDC